MRTGTAVVKGFVVRGERFVCFENAQQYSSSPYVAIGEGYGVCVGGGTQPLELWVSLLWSSSGGLEGV